MLRLHTRDLQQLDWSVQQNTCFIDDFNKLALRGVSTSPPSLTLIQATSFAACGNEAISLCEWISFRDCMWLERMSVFIAKLLPCLFLRLFIAKLLPCLFLTLGRVCWLSALSLVR
jgi:hypothetical protein